MPEIVSEDVELAARRVLRQFGLDRAVIRIQQPAVGRGFSGAVVLKANDGEQAYCLRRWPRGGLSATRLKELHHFLGQLQSSGIDEVPVPLVTSDGKTLLNVNDQLWQLEPWLPGTADFHRSPTNERLRSAMRVLARVHLAAERYECRPAGREWFARHSAAPSPACWERLQIIRRWSAPRCDAVAMNLFREPSSAFRKLAREVLNLYPAQQPVIAGELRDHSQRPVRLHPCLRDVWHDHLLFTGNELTGLIDPAATRTESIAADLSRLLGSLLADDRPRWQFALAAYSDVRPLSVDERRLIAVLDRSSVLLSGLTWIDRRQNGALADEDIPRIVPRLRTIVERLQRLRTDLR